jgi:branched-chain amino acid transport system permease protein
MLIGAFTWTEFAQQLAAGIREGAIYAGLALAIVIIYRTTRVINFAQGEMATFTTFISWSLMNHGLSFWTAFPIVLAIAFTGGVAIERIERARKSCRDGPGFRTTHWLGLTLRLASFP